MPPSPNAKVNDHTHEQPMPGLTWVMITDPRQSRDKTTMRNVRMHVMNDYLSKEQRNPNSTDARVRNSRFRTTTSRSPEVGRKTTITRARSRSPCARDLVIDYGSTESKTSIGKMEEVLHDDERTAALAPFAASKAQLGGPGSKLDAFNATPRFVGRPNFDIRMLKHSCVMYFGSQAMCKKWVPMLFAGRGAFLSTLCISSSYLDMMHMDFSTATTPHSIESVRTLTVREEIVRVIGECLSDPDTCCSDGNIVSVLHLVFGEMIVANDEALQWHEQGLYSMVQKRGGLDKLGGDGLLASMVTIEMFELSIFRENSPRQEYLEYARYILRAARQDRSSAIPESPLYYSSGLHHTLGRTRCCDEETLDLINLVRDLTQVILDLHNVSSTADFSVGTFGPDAARTNYSMLEPEALHKRKNDSITRILKSRVGDDPVYEATRLCALLYATSINFNTPLSTTARTFPFPSTSSIAVEIRSQLKGTDLSNCWDSMVGILLFITLVTGAACNDTNADDVEILATKRWMVALAIRCTILLSFQHTDAVLKTLRTFLTVQEVLRGADGE